MSCSHSEKDLALYVEGDLDPTGSHAIQMHLPTCESCRNIVAELKESQAILRMLREETVSSSALSGVRNRVLDELQSRRRFIWGRWIYALAGGMLVAVVSVGVLHHMRKPEPNVQPIVVNVPVTHPVVPSTTEIRAGDGDAQKMPKVHVNPTRTDRVSPRRRQRVASAETTPEPVKPVVVKLLTDDPNIVIYWLVEPKGGSL
jgi:anti-sigma factor RsiW